MKPLQEPTLRATGNLECIKLLEAWLERVKTHGQVGFVAIVAAENLKHVVSDFAGSMELAFAANWGMDTVKYQLLARGHARHEEEFAAPKGESADKVCYDISVAPCCYDFIVWLALAEMIRVKEGAPAPLKVGFKMLDSAIERARHEKQRDTFYKNVIFPSLAFVGAVADRDAASAMVLDRYTLRPVVELAQKGIPVPEFKALPEDLAWVDRFLSKDPRAPVVITLREVKGRWEHRNSNMTAWIKFAEYLDGKGERVIFVRDTEVADEEITGYEICPAASRQVRTRLALYERAKCNMFVSNGPWQLAVFGARPWLMFVETDPMSVFFPETPQWWRQWQGIHDEQLPWSKPDQKIIWKRDDYENLVEGWNFLYPPEIMEAAE